MKARVCAAVAVAVTLSLVCEPNPTRAFQEQKKPAVVEITLKDGAARLDARMTRDDAIDAIRKGCHCKIYTVKLSAGKTYQIDMESEDLDAFLRLEDAAGKRLAENDDVSPDNLNARIVFKCQTDGTYRIIATTFDDGETGAFLLKIRQQ
jgi:hypothetical protein